jgi:hypothetical protein
MPNRRTRSRAPREALTVGQLDRAIRRRLAPAYTVHHIQRVRDHLVVILEGYDGDPAVAQRSIGRMPSVAHAQLVTERTAIALVWPATPW